MLAINHIESASAFIRSDDGNSGSEIIQHLQIGARAARHGVQGDVGQFHDDFAADFGDFAQ